MADGCFYIKKEHRSIIPSADRAGGGLLFDHRLDTNATVERTLPHLPISQFRAPSGQRPMRTRIISDGRKRSATRRYR
jgi:hypothetical protein